MRTNSNSKTMRPCAPYIFSLLILSLPCWIQAQDMVNQGNVITIGPGAMLTTASAIINNGEINNEGIINVGGDWLNYGSYNSGEGMVGLIGETTQHFDNNQDTVFAMTLSGGGDKILDNNLSIAAGGNILFENGILVIEGERWLSLGNNVEINGGNERSFVSGKLYQQGLGFKFFPIGKGGLYRPIEFENVTGEDPWIGVEVINEQGSSILADDIEKVSDIRYWQLTHMVDPNSFDGSQVAVSVGEDEPFDNINDLVIVRANERDGIFKNLRKSRTTGDIFNGKVYSELPLANGIVALAMPKEITLETLLFVPNIFNPSSSNPEERGIKVYGKEIADNEFYFKIFDRWGNVLYQTNSFQEANTYGWSIRDTHTIRGIQSFRYILAGKFKDGRSFNRQGKITLMK